MNAFLRDAMDREVPAGTAVLWRLGQMGLLARSATVRRIVEKMREIFELFDWE